VKTGIVAAALGASLLGLPAEICAQTAQKATAMKPKPAMAEDTTVTVLVTNARKADLLQLQAAEAGSANWKKAFGALKAGQKAEVKLPRGPHCRVDLHGTFANGESMDASDVDVCEQKTLNLTD
jgi:hypothetical protein